MATPNSTMAAGVGVEDVDEDLAASYREFSVTDLTKTLEEIRFEAI